jgi:hypothetical protein
MQYYARKTHAQIYDSQTRIELMEKGISWEEAIRMVPSGLSVAEAVTKGKKIPFFYWHRSFFWTTVVPALEAADYCAVFF